MDHLEAGVGDAINRYAIESGVHLVPYDKEMSAVDHSTIFARGRDKLMATLRLLTARG
jgi:hypothetical protein